MTASAFTLQLFADISQVSLKNLYWRPFHSERAFGTFKFGLLFSTSHFLFPWPHHIHLLTSVVITPSEQELKWWLFGKVLWEDALSPVEKSSCMHHHNGTRSDMGNTFAFTFQIYSMDFYIWKSSFPSSNLSS